ncbi:hypothetical protein RHSIM_Rhsim10G0037000 [Rhododendron simsii]|uniref:non-specific serine/threonine protein kinase n=1 Tax=Rhododendron simsii TaxID=118357 RepID=A0A834G9H2_RHOSS|nr:hypothetical protein RHSIM_Rhsim10G0037000 [Rhododendron simsii]
MYHSLSFLLYISMYNMKLLKLSSFGCGTRDRNRKERKREIQEEEVYEQKLKFSEMKRLKMAGSSFVWMMILGLGLQLQVEIARAQNQTSSPSTGTTPAAEVDALNSFLRKLGVSPSNQFEITDEPCVGFAINDSISLGNGGASHNPGFKCKCNGTVCHITGLKVYAKGVAGQIPDELWSLSYLTELNLAKNNLTGPVSPSVGNLTQMQYMNLDHNSFSGELPKELGNLTELLILAFSTNDFSGPLPSELGKLTKLQHLYMDSSGVSGPIPSTFAALQNMQVMRFWGNSLEGPIPSTFSNLAALEDLRISDLANGGSSLAFLKDMKSLKVLILRNNDISGSIPSNIGDYQNLSHLFLGSNKFTGPSIPPQYAQLFQRDSCRRSKTKKELLEIIIEMNFFSIWKKAVQREARRGIVEAVNWENGNMAHGVLPSGLRCLQRNFPCGRNRPVYDNFSVKCGGPETNSTNHQIIYERDNETLGPATYYVASTDRWAVSNVGHFWDKNNSKYTSDSSSQIVANTSDPQLFWTARISPVSLRYYGLGLVNGNYTVRLQFAEITILNSPYGWESLGRRVFDIYIQGNRVRKDFNIKKEARGTSFEAVQEDFLAQVSENYLEIHLFWAGKGTCCIPTAGTYGPSISAISVTRDPTGKKIKIGLILGIFVPVGVVSCLCVLALFYFVQRRKRLHRKKDEELLGIEARPYTFSYAELKAATADFNPANKLGEGGFGPVYKGTLNDGRVIAVKQLSVASHQGKSQFVAEIATISAVQQRNLVKFGYLAPEYAMRGHLTEKADVFGFGVVALEVVSGRPNSDTSLEAEKMYLLDWAWHLHQNNNEVELVDDNLSEFNEEEVKRLIRVALLCTQSSPQARPSMSRAVAMLLADIEVGAVTAQPGYLMSGWKFNDTTSFMSTDTQTTKTEHSHSSSSSSTWAIPDRDTKPMLQEIIRE